MESARELATETDNHTNNCLLTSVPECLLRYVALREDDLSTAVYRKILMNARLTAIFK